jgi:hypothetical protein
MSVKRQKFIWCPIQQKVVSYEEKAKAEVHNIITDEMDPLWHPATGEMIDSKSKFRERTKASGCVEIGDQMHTLKPYNSGNVPEIGGMEEDIGRAYDEVTGRK